MSAVIVSGHGKTGYHPEGVENIQCNNDGISYGLGKGLDRALYQSISLNDDGKIGNLIYHQVHEQDFAQAGVTAHLSGP